MGKATGMAKNFSGKVGDQVYRQQKDGTTTVSAVQKKSEKPPSMAQLSTLQDTALVAVLSKIKEFIAVGYESRGKAEKRSPYNSAVSYFRFNVITGVYPERRIDFSKMLVSQGKMRMPENAAVVLIETGFSFTWNPEIKVGTHHSDHIMLMAFFPELGSAVYEIAGAKRNAGTDQLDLTGTERGYTAEIYISFIANTRKSISNSIYLGQLIW